MDTQQQWLQISYGLEGWLGAQMVKALGYMRYRILFADCNHLVVIAVAHWLHSSGPLLENQPLG